MQACNLFVKVGKHATNDIQRNKMPPAEREFSPLIDFHHGNPHAEQTKKVSLTGLSGSCLMKTRRSPAAYKKI